MCLRVLEGLGVTAVLNAAQGEMTDWNYVNTKASYYSGKSIRYAYLDKSKSLTIDHFYPLFVRMISPLGAIHK